MGAAAAAAASALAGCATGGERRRAGGASPAGEGNCPFRLGMAGYTLGGFDLDGALKMLERDGVRWFCAKDCHYPLKSSPAELKALVEKSGDRGVRLYAAGPISVNTPDEARRAFEYCATLGVPTFSGVPGEKGPDGKPCSSRRMCEAVAAMADEYGINFAIHNHGANPKTGNPRLYPTAVATWELIRDLSPRLGFCLDIAYTEADGYDSADILRRYAGRVFDVHLRNTAVRGNGSSGAPADAGTIDYLKVVRALKETGYSGVCGLELRNAFLKPSDINPGADPSWIPRSIGYFRGLMGAV
jgi:sugar phosphate isomerase/epimerase